MSACPRVPVYLYRGTDQRVLCGGTREYGITREYYVLVSEYVLITHGCGVTCEYSWVWNHLSTPLRVPHTPHCINIWNAILNINHSWVWNHSRVLHTPEWVSADACTLSHECAVPFCNMHIHPSCIVGIFSRILSSIPLVHAVAGVVSKFCVILYANGNPHTWCMICTTWACVSFYAGCRCSWQVRIFLFCILPCC